MIRKMRSIFKDKIKNKYLLFFISLVPLLLFILGFMIDSINSIIVNLHFFIFLLILDLIILFINKIRKINIKPYVSIIISIVITACWLGNSYYLAHHVVRTNYVVTSNNKIGVDRFRIAQISDSHIGATMDGKDFSNYMKLINRAKPDVVVITGDFVDDDTTYNDMVESCKALGNLKTRYGVYFVYGNHDKGYSNYRGFDDNILRKELEKNNVKILEDSYVDIGENIILVGRKDAQETNRLSAKDLTKDLDKNKYIIMLDHEPNDYKNEVSSSVDLVLSGHTHGGQLIPLGPIGLLLKANDSIYGIEKRNNTNFIVSSGLGDWAIKFKSGTKSEYVIIDIKNK